MSMVWFGEERGIVTVQLGTGAGPRYRSCGRPSGQVFISLETLGKSY